MMVAKRDILNLTLLSHAYQRLKEIPMHRWYGSNIIELQSFIHISWVRRTIMDTSTFVRSPGCVQHDLYPCKYFAACHSSSLSFCEPVFHLWYIYRVNPEYQYHSCILHIKAKFVFWKQIYSCVNIIELRGLYEDKWLRLSDTVG